MHFEQFDCNVSYHRSLPNFELQVGWVPRGFIFVCLPRIMGDHLDILIRGVDHTHVTR